MKVYLSDHREQGFFSSVNLILMGIRNLLNSGVENYYIDWKNTLYQNDNENLFDKYFWQQEIIPTNDFIRYSAYDLIYTNEISKKFKEGTDDQIIKILIKNKYFENSLLKTIFLNSFKTFNCLGVQIRKTDHGHHGILLEDEIYIKNIDQHLDEYSSIFLATDDKDIAIKFKNRYGKLLNLNENIDRVSGKIGVHNSNFKNKNKLASDVLTDAFSLSCCDKILITQSNISAYVKIINSNISYEYIDNHISYKM